MDDKTLAALMAQYPATIDDKGTTVVSGVVRLSFVNLTKPAVPKGSNKDPRFSVLCIVPPAASLDPYFNAQRNAWALGRIAGEPKHFAVKRQSEMLAKGAKKGKVYEGFSENGGYFNAETKNPPTIIGADGKTDTNPNAAGRFYSGCWARVKVFAQAYDQAGNQGVKYWLQAVQFIADDTKLGDDASGGFGEVAGGSMSSAAAPRAAGPANVPAASQFGF